VSGAVLLTGASGYLGAAIAQSLRQQGWLVRTAGRRDGDDVRFDLLEPQGLAARELPPALDACIHVAAAHEVACREDPQTATVANVDATGALLEAAARAGITRFVYLSTFHVFGRPEGEIDETTLPSPRDDYGRTHWQAEERVREWADRAPRSAIVLRPANVFGLPADWSTFARWTLAPFDFMRQALRTGRIELRSDGSATRAYVPLATVCQAAAAACRGALPPLVHLGGRAWRMDELARLAAAAAEEVSGRPVTVHLGRETSREPPHRFTSRHRPVDEDDAGQDMRRFLRALGHHLRSESP
jgi:UDP-glucose 4-epimerase